MKIIIFISKIFSIVSAFAAFILMILTVSDVTMRYVFSAPIKGTYEICMMLMIVLSLGFSLCSLKGNNISMEIVVSRLSPKMQAIFDSVTLFIGLAICIMITWQGILDSIWEMELKSVLTVELPFPKYPFWWIFVISFFMLCISMFMLWIDKLKTLVKR
jgi:TRAP-type transport system small permease protein